MHISTPLHLTLPTLLLLSLSIPTLSHPLTTSTSDPTPPPHSLTNPQKQKQSTLHPRTPNTNAQQQCGTITKPTTAYNIYSDQPDEYDEYTLSDGISDDYQYFSVYVTGNSSNPIRQDVVLTFENMPCPPASPGPFEFQFDYHPPTPPSKDTNQDDEDNGVAYLNYNNPSINMYRINGPLPAEGEITYENIEAQTGSLVGTFQLPHGDEEAVAKVVYINSLVCEPTMSLRFGVAGWQGPERDAVYFSGNGTGVRDLSGC